MSCNYFYYTQDVLFKKYIYSYIFILFVCTISGSLWPAWILTSGTVIIVVQSAHEVHNLLAVEAMEKY